MKNKDKIKKHDCSKGFSLHCNICYLDCWLAEDCHSLCMDNQKDRLKMAKFILKSAHDLAKSLHLPDEDCDKSCKHK